MTQNKIKFNGRQDLRMHIAKTFSLEEQVSLAGQLGIRFLPSGLEEYRRTYYGKSRFRHIMDYIPVGGMPDWFTHEWANDARGFQVALDMTTRYMKEYKDAKSWAALKDNDDAEQAALRGVEPKRAEAEHWLQISAVVPAYEDFPQWELIDINSPAYDPERTEVMCRTTNRMKEIHLELKKRIAEILQNPTCVEELLREGRGLFHESVRASQGYDEPMQEAFDKLYTAAKAVRPNFDVS